MKISRRQLNRVKKSIREKLSNQEEDNLNEPDRLKRAAIREIRKAYKDMGGPDKKLDKDAKKKLQQERAKQNVSITWGFDVGDAVEFKTSSRSNKDAEFGIVLEMPNTQLFRNVKNAIRDSQVCLLTANGRIVVHTKYVSKIEDED